MFQKRWPGNTGMTWSIFPIGHSLHQNGVRKASKTTYEQVAISNTECSPRTVALLLTSKETTRSSNQTSESNTLSLTVATSQYYSKVSTEVFVSLSYSIPNMKTPKKCSVLVGKPFLKISRNTRKNQKNKPTILMRKNMRPSARQTIRIRV